MNIVYIIEYENGVVKIGKTVDFDRRLKTLMSSSPIAIIRYYVRTCTNHHSLETIMHKKFSDVRLHGEFFRCSYAEAMTALDEEVKGIVEYTKPPVDYSVVAKSIVDTFYPSEEVKRKRSMCSLAMNSLGYKPDELVKYYEKEIVDFCVQNRENQESINNTLDK